MSGFFITFAQSNKYKIIAMRIVYSSYKRSGIGAVISVLLGVVLLVWPTYVLDYLVKLIGAVFFIGGVISLLLSSREQARSSSGFASFTGFGSIVLGLVLWFMAGIFTDVLMYVLGFILLLVGIGQLTLLLSARKYGRIPVISYLYPLLILGVGLVIFVNPFKAKETIIMVFGATSIFYGLTSLLNHYQVNKIRRDTHEQEQQKRLSSADVEDTAYEEV